MDASKPYMIHRSISMSRSTAFGDPMGPIVWPTCCVIKYLGPRGRLLLAVVCIPIERKRVRNKPTCESFWHDIELPKIRETWKLKSLKVVTSNGIPWCIVPQKLTLPWNQGTTELLVSPSGRISADWMLETEWKRLWMWNCGLLIYCAADTNKCFETCLKPCLL